MQYPMYVEIDRHPTGDEALAECSSASDAHADAIAPAAPDLAIKAVVERPSLL